MNRFHIGFAVLCCVACSRVEPASIDAGVGDASIDAAGAMVTLTLLKTGNGTVTSNTAHLDCGLTCSETVPVGTVVTLIAAPDTGNVFTSWGGGCSGSDRICSLTVNRDTTISADFGVATHTLTLAVGGNAAGAVTSTPAGINCPGTCTTTVPHNTELVLTAMPGGNAQFLGWGGGGCTGTAECTVMVTDDTTINASFGLDYSLVVVRTGPGAASGNVTSSPRGIDCGVDCDEIYPADTMVILTETHSADVLFGGWGGACAASGTDPTCTITITSALAATAAFAPRSLTLMTATSGSGAGTITSSPSGITCGNGNTACSAIYDFGQSVELTATPNIGSNFVGWSGACSGRGSCIVTMDEARNVSATFVPAFTLSVIKSGSGASNGTVSSNAGAIDCGSICSDSFDVGAVVTLTANAGTGNQFDGWSGAPGCTTDSTCNVTMDRAANVIAMFTLERHTITIDRVGPQAMNGTVTSSPGSIDCGSTCLATVDHGTVVTLSTIAGVNTVFGGWTGGGCGTTSPCMMTVTADATITATFNTGTHDTQITNTPPLMTTSTTAVFEFDSVPSGAGAFSCAIDESPFVPCSSPISYSGLASTYHRFRAVTAGANPDPTAAEYAWHIHGGSYPSLPDSFSARCADGVSTTLSTCPAGVAGQDGDYRIDVPTYSSTTSTVTDSITGLMWQRAVDTSGDNATAMTYCEDLALDGFSDWRLPTRYELITVMDAQATLPPLPSVFTGVAANSLLRTSTRAVGSPTQSWGMSTNYPILRLVADTQSQPILCVRNSTGGGTLIRYGANTMFDGRTGLYWQSPTNAASTWSAAISTCEDLTLDSWSDWRLPSQKELASLVDDNATNPAISPLLSSRPSATFWTSTPVNPTGAYAINFTDGANTSISNAFSSSFQSRCVRTD